MDLEQKAIERIRLASEMSLQHYKQPLICTYSGGKDSDVMLELFRRSGVPFEVKHGLTTADAPQTVRHVKKSIQGAATKRDKSNNQLPGIQRRTHINVAADPAEKNAADKKSAILL